MIATGIDLFERESSQVLLRLFQNRSALKEQILQVYEDPNLLSLCAHYDAVDKIVLWVDSDSQQSLRMHLYADRPPLLGELQADISHAHNHRWNFSSLILFGGYRHTLYAKEEGALIPVMIREEEVGDHYTLHHLQYHSLVAKPNTVSLLMRGALEKESFETIGQEGEKKQWKGADRLEKTRMTQKRYGQLIAKLIDLGIIRHLG
ncbi:MAG: hypothetical protein HYZ48_03575 [Chlamydiales bacterium]|nr:hypothetical protein [Chlamydiales bacterium]